MADRSATIATPAAGAREQQGSATLMQASVSSSADRAEQREAGLDGSTPVGLAIELDHLRRQPGVRSAELVRRASTPNAASSRFARSVVTPGVSRATDSMKCAPRLW